MIQLISSGREKRIVERRGRSTKPERKTYHEPVMVRKVLEVLAPAPGKVIVDGTLGAGGHAEALLEAGAKVIGLDQDPDALVFASERLSHFGENFQAVRANYSTVGDVLDLINIDRIDGVLLDLGVSSWQLESAERGFSFAREGPLDMRMDPEAPITAADLVNKASGEQLERIFRNFGEESAARRIAARLVRDRMQKPFVTTSDLAGSIERIIPRRGKIHPATRVFQALRIAVNRELEALQDGLEEFALRLAPGGRFAVISFHSLEDRIVKNFFRARSAEWLDRPEWPEPRQNPEHFFRLLTTKPLVPSAEEQQSNPRSRSARLRAVERI
jgi:16S rRNA (cytosine1402-N4)-methyltransferase